MDTVRVTARSPLLDFAAVPSTRRRYAPVRKCDVRRATKTRIVANWSVARVTEPYSRDAVIYRLPRLGSGVRIASPAPVSFGGSSKRKAADFRGFFASGGLRGYPTRQGRKIAPAPSARAVCAFSHGSPAQAQGSRDIISRLVAFLSGKCRRPIRLGSHAKGTVEPLLPGIRQLYD